MNKRVVYWLKAIGFLLFIAFFYFYASIAVGAVVGVIAAIGSVGNLTATDEESYAEYFNSILGTTSEMMPYMSIAISVIVIGMIAVAFIARKDKFMVYVSFRKIKLTDGLLLGLVGIMMQFAIIPILHYVLQMLPQEMVNNYFDLMELMTGVNMFGMVLMISINAPIFEEIMVRGVILNDFKKAAPTWLTLVIQALVFGIMHMNIIQGSYAFAIGLVFGIAYLKYKSIWAPIIMHFTFNTSALIIGELHPDVFNDVEHVIMFAVGAIGLMALAKVLQNNYVAEDYVIEEEPVTVPPVEVTEME